MTITTSDDTTMSENILFRDQVCVLGLPFDVLTEEQACVKINECMSASTDCFLSTPNLNFAVSSLKDADFRDSVIQSDLSVADGMPIIIVSRLIGTPLPERIAGSNVFEKIRTENRQRKVKVFFFGGMGDVAERAMNTLNKTSAGAVAVGALNPGTGAIEDMSTSEIIRAINEAEPDFVVVSLGAKKGQQWIMHNKDKLSAPILSHLGAVVNFVAGEVKRAPAIWQKTGLEWVWRIVEEPALWKRYFSDGMQLLNLIFTRILPLAIYKRFFEKRYRAEPLCCNPEVEDDLISVELSGAVLPRNIATLKEQLTQLSFDRHVEMDLSKLHYADSRFWALCMQLKIRLSSKGVGLTLRNPSKSLLRLARLNMVDCYFDLQN